MPLERMRAPDPARDLAYSEWHRPDSLSRFVDRATANRMSMLDLDDIEIDAATNTPVALIETTERPVAEKNTRWTQTMGQLARVPAYVVQTVLAEHRNPTCKRTVLDIEHFAVMRLGDRQTLAMSPEAYARWLVSLRDGRSRLTELEDAA